MNKKFLSLVLALVMVLGTFANVFAAAAPAKEEAKKEAKKEAPKLTSTDAKVNWLIDNKIVIGNADADGKATGEMGLNDNIRRDHVAKMLVFALGQQDFAAKLQGVYRPFPDVELTSIVNGFISVAASKTSNGVPIIAGYKDGTFRPTREVTYAELAKMLVVAIDKDLNPEKVKGMKWHQDWMKRAVELGILDGLSIDNPDAKAVRRDAFAMIYNAFFQLKEVKAVPANETRGIISEHSKDLKLVLNQGDFKKEFKVNENTVFVKQDKSYTKWLKRPVEYAKDLEVGSLVRVLSDKDGVVTHIIEMGNPVEGIKNVGDREAWVDLGNKTFKVAASNPWQYAKKTPANNVQLIKDQKGVKDGVVFNGTKFEVNKNTEFYVADYEAGVLTKVKDFDAAYKLVNDNGMTRDVYLGYEVLPTSKVNEAKVVVFNKTNIEANSRLVRVAKVVSNPDFLLQVNAPGEMETTLESFSTRDNAKVWPYNYKLNALDVIKLVSNGDKVKGDPVKVIDYKTFDIYKIVDFKVNGESTERAKANQIVLADYEGLQQTFDLPKEYDAFFGNKLTKGAHVQIAYRDAAKNIVGVISEVGNAPLRGHLPNGERVNLIKGTVVGFIENSASRGLNRVLILEGKNKVPTVYVTQLKEGAFKMKDSDKKYAYVEVMVRGVDKDYVPAEIVEVVSKSANADKSAVTPEQANYYNAINELMDAVAKEGKMVAAQKPLVENVIKYYNGLTAEDQVTHKPAVNKAIESFNKVVPGSFDIIK